MVKNPLETGSEIKIEPIFRYLIMSLVLTREKSGEKRSEAVKAVAGQSHWSPTGMHKVGKRTIYRYMEDFNENGLPDIQLHRKERLCTAISDALLDFFVQQKNDDGKTSIPEMIKRAVELGHINSAEDVDRVTVWRALQRKGVPTHRSKTPKKDKDTRRFAFAHRMEMVICDGKHFRAGAKRLKRVVLFYLDDSSRMGLNLIVGTSETSELYLKGLYSVIQRYGLMDANYLDNGSGFKNNDAIAVNNQLGTLLIHGAPNYPQGRGKIEKFNQTALGSVLRTLDSNPDIDPDCAALTLRLRHYLFERYNHTPHESLGCTPYQRFNQDSRALCFMENTKKLRQAFIIRFHRHVSKDHIVSLKSVKYETPRGYSGAWLFFHWNILDQTLSMIHENLMIRLHPVDLNANAQDRRALPLDESTTRPRQPKSAAELDYNRKMRGIVDPDGGFSDKEGKE